MHLTGGSCEFWSFHSAYTVKRRSEGYVRGCTDWMYLPDNSSRLSHKPFFNLNADLRSPEATCWCCNFHWKSVSRLKETKKCRKAKRVSPFGGSQQSLSRMPHLFRDCLLWARLHLCVSQVGLSPPSWLEQQINARVWCLGLERVRIKYHLDTFYRKVTRRVSLQGRKRKKHR